MSEGRTESRPWYRLTPADRQALWFALVTAGIPAVLLYVTPRSMLFVVLSAFVFLAGVAATLVMMLVYALVTKFKGHVPVRPFVIWVALSVGGFALATAPIGYMEERRLDRLKSDCTTVVAAVERHEAEEGRFPRRDELKAPLPDGVEYSGGTDWFRLFIPDRYGGGFMPSGWIYTSDEPKWTYWMD